MQTDAVGTEITGGRCPRCGGGHTIRQRCPLDPEPAAATTSPRSYYASATTLRRSHLPSPLPQKKLAPLWLTTLRWFGGITGTIVLVTCVSVAGVKISDLPLVATNVYDALAIILAAVGIGLIFGMALLWFSARAYAKCVFAVLSLVLITGGLAMLVTAPVIRQMNTPHLAEYRGFWAMTWFGVTTTLAGIALAALCVRWSMQRRARQHLIRWSRLLGSIYGVYLGLMGCFALILFFSLINGDAYVNDDGDLVSVVEQALGFTAIIAWLLVPGVILTYHGIAASMGEGSGPFRPPIAIVALALYGAVLVIGELNMSRESPMAWPMPVLHVAAAALPGITLAAMAGRGTLLRGVPVSGLTWRQVTLAAAIAMAVATWIAVYVESIGSLYAIVLLLVHNGAFEFSQNSSAAWDQIRDSDLILTHNEQFAAGLVTAAVLAPLSEEFAKSLGARFMMRATTTRAQAFQLGAFAGAGFGFLEAMLYGLAGVQESLGDWWQIMLVRGGSTSLHVICTGLTGLAWWYWSIGRRHRVSLALFATAIAIHAGWNGAFTAIDSRILGLDTLQDRTLEIIAYIIVAIVSGAMIAAIPIIARKLRDVPTPPVEGTAITSMTPWLA